MRVIAITPEKSRSNKKASAPEPADPILVNGVEISSEAIATEAQHHPMPKDKPGWAWRAAAHALVLKELLHQTAQTQAVEIKPIELSEGQRETELEASIRALIENAIEPAEYDEAMLRATYDANPSRFTSPSLYEAAHILFVASADDAVRYQAALQQAQLVLAELKTNPSQFSRLAQEYSACPSKANGGLLGQLAAGDTVPEFEAVLATMTEGAIYSEPVATRYGYHIIRLDARQRGQVLPFEAVLPYLKEAHEKASWVKKGREYMQRLVQGAEIKGIDMADAPWAAAGRF